MFPPSELIINEYGTIFHLHIKPEQLARKVILVGDPGRVSLVASHFDTIECDVQSREFHTMTGVYKGTLLQRLKKDYVPSQKAIYILNSLNRKPRMKFLK